MPRAAVLALLLAAAPAFAGETVEKDDWYALYVNDTKSGHAHTVVSRVEDETAADPRPVWVTTTDTFLRLARSGSEIELSITSRTEEDADGRVLRYRTTQRMSGQEFVTEGRVEGDVVHVTQNGSPGRVDYPADALGPAAIDRRVAAAGFEPGTRTSVVGFSTDAPGQPARMTFTVDETESRQIIDRRLRLHRIEVENSQSAARRSLMWYDGTGCMHESESEVPGIGTLRMARTTELLATSVTTPADVFSTSLIVPDRGIPGPRRARRAVFRFSRTDGSPFEAELSEGEGQTVGPLRDDGSRDVTIEAWTPPEDFESLRRPVTDEALAPYLARAAYLETDDPLIVQHAASAVGEHRDALTCARRIEDYVRWLVADKSMDVGFATAAETARSREGDCSEHAMLAAALARAAGLPSRVVMGIVYVPGLSAEGIGPRGAFGYHMWTEVLVAEGRWLPIDAALGGFDATHIAMAKSDLSTDSPASRMILPLLEAIRDLRIEVVRVEVAEEGR